MGYSACAEATEGSGFNLKCSEGTFGDRAKVSTQYLSNSL